MRQAIGVLTARGLVESRVGSGTFVVGTTEAGDAPPGPATRGSLAEIMEARLVFEVGVARLAARRAQRSREDIDLLRAIVEALEQPGEPRLVPDRDRYRVPPGDPAA